MLIERNISRCGDMWNLFRRGLPFDDWELRSALADHYGIKPYFLVNDIGDAILPCGVDGDQLLFFGGQKYAELNRPLGDDRSLPDLIQRALQWENKVRLLAWDYDPFNHLTAKDKRFDVPFNQYWIVPGSQSVEELISKLPAKTAKEFRYLLRKFEYDFPATDSWTATSRHLEDFFDKTSQSFAKRGRSFALDHPLHRQAAMIICEASHKRGALRIANVLYRGTCVGLCAIVDDPLSKEAVYLLNLYDTSPSDASNGVTIAAITYACSAHRRVNALRGSFTLKAKYGMIAEPSYALVKDKSWNVQPQTDLNEEELHAVYGRPFGHGLLVN